jgi:hypothetical protein
MVLSMLHAAEVVTTQQGNTAFGTYLADDMYRMPAAQEAWRGTPWSCPLHYPTSGLCHALTVFLEDPQQLSMPLFQDL